MSVTNPLYSICANGTDSWNDPIKLATFIGFQFKLAGYDWRSTQELGAIMDTLMSIGFIEYDKNMDKARIKPIYIQHYGKPSVTIRPQMT